METPEPIPQDPSPWISLRDSLFRPRSFFASLQTMGSWPKALLFAALLGLLSSVGFTINDFIFPEGSAFWVGPWAWYWNLITWPLTLAGECLFLAWFHWVLKWRHGAAFPFKATFRAYAYSAGPNVFNLIPIVGMWIAIVWGLALGFYAIKTLQKTTWTRVITSFLIANALLGLLIFLLIFAAGYFRHFIE